MVFDRGQIRPGGKFYFKNANQYWIRIWESRQKINIKTPLLPTLFMYKSLYAAGDLD